MNKKSEMQHNPCFDSAQLNKSLELSITKDELSKALFKIYKLQEHIKKLKQQVERANEIEAAAVEKALAGFQCWYMEMEKPIAELVVNEVGRYMYELRQQATGEN